MEIRYPINYIKEKGICGSINLTILNITWAQFYGLENSVGCIAHGVTKSRTRLSDTHFISLVAQSVKNPHVMREIWFYPWVRKVPWRRAWQPNPVFFPEESPWTGEPGGVSSMGSQIVEHVWVTKHTKITYKDLL